MQALRQDLPTNPVKQRSRARRVLRRVGLVLALTVGFSLVVLVVGFFWLDGRIEASLPILEGELALEGLTDPVIVERDELGIATIRGATRIDVVRATGFLHAQERFFQMDLLRRTAAGELAALIGPPVIAADRRNRLHRFRDVARRAIEAAGDADRLIFRVYAEGVNAGLGALGDVPPEYLALRRDPEPWLPEDTALVVLAMYFDLQGGSGGRESTISLLHDVLPEELVAFLVPVGTEWDAPVLGGPPPEASMPSAQVFDLRNSQPAPIYC